MSTALLTELDGLLHDQPQNPLRPQQMTEYRDELDRNRKMVSAPPWVTGHSRALAAKNARRIQETLDAQAPKKIEEPGRANRVYALAAELVERVIKPTLMPEAELRRSGSSFAVDHVRSIEWAPPVKRAVLTWKRAMRSLDPDNEAPNFTNIEQFRPRGLRADGVSTFMADGQVPGVFGFGPEAKARWPLGEPTVETPLKIAQRRDATAEEPAPTKKKRQAPPSPVYRCEAEGCDFVRRGGFGKKLLAKHQTVTGHTSAEVHGGESAAKG